MSCARPALVDGPWPQPRLRRRRLTSKQLRRPSPGRCQRKKRLLLGCHVRTDALSMPEQPAVKLGCTDCHGGIRESIPPKGLARLELESALRATLPISLSTDRWGYRRCQATRKLHSAHREMRRLSPLRNPGDYAVAKQPDCACHLPSSLLPTRLMSTAPCFGAELSDTPYCPSKRYILGEPIRAADLRQASGGPCCPTRERTFTAWLLPGSGPCRVGKRHRRATTSVSSSRRRVTGNRFPEICSPTVTRGLQT